MYLDARNRVSEAKFVLIFHNFTNFFKFGTKREGLREVFRPSLKNNVDKHSRRLRFLFLCE